MRIALLTDGIFPYVIGGMQKHSYFLAKELALQGHTVYLFHCNESSLDASKLEFFTEEERKYIKSFLLHFPRKNYFPFHYLYESYKYSQAIYRELEPLLTEIDFIFAQGFCAWALLNKIRNSDDKYTPPPVAVHFHGLEMFQNIPSFKARLSRYPLQWAVKRNLVMADYAISYGGKITEIISHTVDKTKIWEVPGAIDSKWLKPAPDASIPNKTRFVFAGRYERRKGIQELNKAIKCLIKISSKAPGMPIAIGINISVDYIGDIPDTHKIAHPALIYHGKISSEEEIKQILSSCDVLVCPSYAEGMPTVIMEAMACGLAIISTNVGAVSLLVDTTNGWLIDNPAPQQILEAMQTAMYDQSLITKKTTSIEKIRKYFLLENVTRRLILKMELACSEKKESNKHYYSAYQ